MNRYGRLAIGIGVLGILIVSSLTHALTGHSTAVSVTFSSGYSSNGQISGTDQIGADSTTDLTYNNGGAVETDFSTGGNLQLDTDLHLQSGGRQLAVAFELPTGKGGCATPCPAPPGGGTKAVLVDAFMSTGNVTLSSGEYVFGLKEMPDPSDGTTDLSINFPGWFVRYQSGALTTQVNVSRSNNVWTITATSTQAAQLIKLSNNGKTETLAGTFFMPTEITITCPSC